MIRIGGVSCLLLVLAGATVAEAHADPDDLSDLLNSTAPASPQSGAAPAPGQTGPAASLSSPAPGSAPGSASAGEQPQPPLAESAGANPVPVANETTVKAARSASKTENRVVEEIVVTAEKREENIQSVPISIQAFSGGALAARGIETETQLGQAIPSLQFTAVAGFTLIYIRGIGTDQFIPSADPSIATYIDGIYVPQGQSTAQSLGNVQRVEVLKGPQGTLFGRNATGGAVSVVTAEPNDVLKASAESEYGRFEDASVKVSVSGPLTSWVSAGVSALYYRKNSFYTDTNYATQPDGTRAARLKLNIHPSDNLSLSLTAFHSEQGGTGSLIGRNTNPSLLGSLLGIQAQPDNYQANSDLVTHSKARQDIDYGIATWKLPRVDLKLLGSYQQIVTDFNNIDFDGSPLPIAAFDTTNEPTHLQTAELQIISNDNTWLADRFKWVAGLYYLHSLAGFNPGDLRVGPQAVSSIENLTGLKLPQDVLNLISLLPVGNTPLTNQGLTVAFGGLLGTYSYSAYTQGTFKFTDWLDFTFGGRYQVERRFLTRSVTNLSDPLSDNPTNVIDLLSFPLPSALAYNFSPKGVLGVHLNDDVLLYGSYSVGFKSGTYNIVNIYTAPSYIVPEQVSTTEVGLKSELLDGQLRLNGALFYNRIKNLQSGFVSLLSGGAVQFLTAAGARTKGAEFDSTLVPLPNLDEGLAFTANAAYVNGIYTNFKNGVGFSQGTGIYTSNLDLNGDRIVRSPTFSGDLGVVQTISNDHGSFELAVDDYYNSGFFYDAYNTVREAPYAILNARAGYLYTPWNARVTFFGKNVLDRAYHYQQFQTDFGIIKTLAAPREYGIRLNWDF